MPGAYIYPEVWEKRIVAHTSYGSKVFDVAKYEASHEKIRADKYADEDSLHKLRMRRIACSALLLLIVYAIVHAV